MAWTENQRYFAEYAIASVESDCDYAACYMVDPITIGITQWYAYNACRLLRRIKNELPASYDMLSSRLKDAVTQHGEEDTGFWTSFYLRNADAQSWKDAVQIQGNTALQDQQFMDDAFNDEGCYYNTLERWGINMGNVRPGIMWMAQYHQSPASTLRVLGQIGGDRTLEDVRDGMLNDRVFNQYSNRINELYDILSAWDSESPPPDFGQSSTEVSQDPTYGSVQRDVKFIRSMNNQDLMVFGNMNTGDRLLCHYNGNGLWLPVRNGNAPNAPSGSSKGEGDPADFPAMRAIWEQFERQFDYGQGPGRLNPENSGYSDCSACIWWAANKATNNKYTWLGTTTATMVTSTDFIEGAVNADKSINADRLQPGDLIIMGFGSSTSHVDWYFGNGVVWSAGSAPLPHHRSDNVSNYLTGTTYDWAGVYRFL